MMQLLTKEIISALPTLYSTEYVPLNEKIVICKFFTPFADWTWFVFEAEIELDEVSNKINDIIFYGMVHGFEKEMGYFRLSDLMEVSKKLIIPVERDLCIFKVPYGQLIRQDR